MPIEIKNIKAGFDSFIDNKASQLDAKQKILVCAGVLILLIVAFFFMVYTPKNEEIEKLNSRKAGLEQEIKKVEATVRQLDKHQAEMKEVELQFKAASLLLPEKKEIPSLLTNISGQGTASGLDFISFKPGGERPKEFYAEIPVDIAVSGSYHNVGIFLDKISKLPRIVSVNNINMQSPKRVGNEMILSTKFNLVTYRFIEPQAQEPGTPQKNRRR
ncbi:MAG: type 4a pilus biogenesis protein PilO [Desulfobulbaceae bacterium]|nr:type 4a pilus biogenesis protein PilO [Desulfobulbaceae bacterium]